MWVENEQDMWELNSIKGRLSALICNPDRARLVGFRQKAGSVFLWLNQKKIASKVGENES